MNDAATNTVACDREPLFIPLSHSRRWGNLCVISLITQVDVHCLADTYRVVAAILGRR